MGEQVFVFSTGKFLKYLAVFFFIPQIALAIGVLTSNRRGVGVQVRKLDVVPLLAAIAGCHCWAALPLLGIGGGGCTSWRIGCGDIAGCRCWVPLPGIGGGVGVHVGGLDVVPLLGAIAGCHCWG